jgi:predicted transcriptional regulator
MKTLAQITAKPDRPALGIGSADSAHRALVVMAQRGIDALPVMEGGN